MRDKCTRADRKATRKASSTMTPKVKENLDTNASGGDSLLDAASLEKMPLVASLVRYYGGAELAEAIKRTDEASLHTILNLGFSRIAILDKNQNVIKEP